MDLQKLPPEFSGLSKEQQAAAIEFAMRNQNSKPESIKSREFVESEQVAKLKSTQVSNTGGESPLISQEVAVPAGSSTGVLSANPELSDSDIAEVLAGKKEVDSPHALLERMINPTGKPAKMPEQEDMAYKA